MHYQVCIAARLPRVGVSNDRCELGVQRNVTATGAAPCLGEEPSSNDVQRHLDAQLAPQQRQQHVLRVPHRRRQRRVGAAAQCQDRLDALEPPVSAVLRPAVRRSTAMASEKKTW